MSPVAARSALGDRHRGGREIRPRVKHPDITRHPGCGGAPGGRDRSRRCRDSERVAAVTAPFDVQRGADRHRLARHERRRRNEAAPVSVRVRGDRAGVHAAARTDHADRPELRRRDAAERELGRGRREVAVRDREHVHGRRTARGLGRRRGLLLGFRDGDSRAGEARTTSKTTAIDLYGLAALASVALYPVRPGSRTPARRPVPPRAGASTRRAARCWSSGWGTPWTCPAPSPSGRVPAPRMPCRYR